MVITGISTWDGTGVEFNHGVELQRSSSEFDDVITRISRETKNQGFPRKTLSGLSLYVLGCAFLIFGFKKITDPFKRCLEGGREVKNLFC